jgi:arylsulfatase A-like enzyme/cytochrome c-type biogenesis protein CcmH/NrfG
LVRRGLLAAAAVASPLLAACAPPRPAAPQAVVLITLDTLRADRVGVYGSSPLTPNLDGLARSGVWFTQARTVVPLTLPAHASLLTGEHPAQHGVRNNGSFRLEEARTTLAEILRGRGWRTAAFVSSFVLDAQFGLQQGFETYEGPLSSSEAAAGIHEPERGAAEITDAAVRWLAGRGAEPFFLWVHYFDPHAPYLPPEPFRSRHGEAPYDGEVAYMDQELGRLLEALRRLPPGLTPLVAAAGDHGESLGEHGEETHGLFLYEATLRVPLILAGAGVPARGADAREATLLDLAPTLLTALRQPAPAALPGRDLLAPAVAPPGDSAPVSFAETLLPCLNFGWSGTEAIVDAPLKLIRGSAAELYDLEADPREEEDLAARRPADRQRLEALLDSQRRSLAGAGGTVPAPPDAEARALLESLGYLAGRGGAPGNGCRSGPDPRRMRPILAIIERGTAEYLAGRHAEAAESFREAARRDARNVQARYYLYQALRRLGREREALEAISAASRLDPANLLFRQEEAMVWLELGEAARAETLLRQSLQTHPGVPKSRYLLAAALLAQRRAAEALAQLEAARTAMPPAADAEHLMARALVALERRPEAIEALRRACALAPDRSDWHGTLAGLLAEQNRSGEAIALLRDFLDRHPNDALALFNLGVLLESSGDVAGALRLYRDAVERWRGDPSRLEALRRRIERLDRSARH